MRFVTFQLGNEAHAGVVSGSDAVLDLWSIGFRSLVDVIESGAEGRAKVENFVYSQPEEAKYRLKDVTLLAPIPRPRKLICVGLNYLDHARESGSQIPDVPTIFCKFATAVIGPGEKIILPRVSQA